MSENEPTREIELNHSDKFIESAYYKFKQAKDIGIPIEDYRTDDSEIIKLVSIVGDNTRSDYDILLERTIVNRLDIRLLIEFEDIDEIYRTFEFYTLGSHILKRELFSDIKNPTEPVILDEESSNIICNIIDTSTPVRFEGHSFNRT